ncbi:MAG: DUF1573 domain-containing protein [Planctomycetes bacterium]|nr:DUF1573 domain-containing protein [Planctomycetota bacterium]
MRALLLLMIAATLASAAQLTFDATAHELSPKLGDTSATATFRFENTGPSPVTIATKTSCACLTAAMDHDTFQPGERGVVVADYSFGPLVGDQVATITVTTTPPGDQPIVLKMVAHIPGPTLDQTTLTWEIGEKRDRKLVTITLPEQGGFAITDAVSRTGTFLPAINPTDRSNVFVLALQPFDTRAEIQDAIDIHTKPASITVVYVRVVKPASPPGKP